MGNQPSWLELHDGRKIINAMISRASNLWQPRSADCQSAVSRIGNPPAPPLPTFVRLPVGDTAGCQPALRGSTNWNFVRWWKKGWHHWIAANASRWRKSASAFRNGYSCLRTFVESVSVWEGSSSPRKSPKPPANSRVKLRHAAMRPVHFRKSSNAFPSFWNVSSRRSTSGDIFRQSRSKE